LDFADARCEWLYRQLDAGYCNTNGICVWSDGACRDPKCSDFGEESECNVVADLNKYRSALQLEGGCGWDANVNGCAGPTNVDSPVETTGTTSFHLALDYGLITGKSETAELSLRKKIADALNGAKLDPEKYNDVKIMSGNMAAEYDTIVTVVGEAVAVEELAALVASSSGGGGGGGGGLSIPLGVHEDFPEFLQGLVIEATANARVVEWADSLRLKSSTVGLLPAADTWSNDDRYNMGWKFLAFPHNDHIDGVDTDLGTVEASVGGVWGSTSVEIVRQAAASVTAVHTNTDGWVWYDRPTVSAVLQANDEGHSHVLAPTTLCLKARYLGFASEEVVGECTTASSTRHCTAEIQLPYQWFPRSAAAKPTIDVYAGICDVAYPKWSAHKYASKITVLTLGPDLSGRKQPAGRVVASLPAATIMSGELVSVPISTVGVARAAGDQRPLQLVQMAFACDANTLSFAGVQFATGWEGSLHCTDASRSACEVVGIRNGGAQAEGDDADHTPFTLEIKVESKSADETAPRWINGTIARLYAADGAVVTASSADIFFVGRGSETDVSTGYIYVSGGDPLVGLIPRVGQTVLINTAALGGDQVTVSLDVIGVHQSGLTAAVAASDLVCSSSNSAVVRSTDDCSAFILDGSETAGGPVKIVVEVGELKQSVPLRVFYPVVGTVEIASVGEAEGGDIFVLNAVRGWTRDTQGEECVQQHQQRELTVSARFACTDCGDELHVMVTEMVSEALDTVDNKIATVGKDGGLFLLAGGKAGTTKVQLNTPHGAVGAVAVKVPGDGAKPVGVQQLLSTVTSEVTIGPQTVVVGPNSWVEYSVHVQNTLYYHAQKAAVNVYALYTDGSVGRIAAGAGLRLAGIGGAVATDADSPADSIEVAAGGSGRLLGVYLESTCKSAGNISGIVAEGAGYVDAPTHKVNVLSVESATIRLAHSGSKASHPALEIYENVTVPVTATYADGHQADVSATTVYDDVSGDPDDLFQVVVDDITGEAVVVVNDPELIGNAVLYVSNPTVAPDAATIEVEVRVLDAVKLTLRASPYPAFAGSSETAAEVLSLIGQSEEYQNALLHADIELSDGSIVDVSLEQGIRFQPIPAGVIQAGSSTPGRPTNLLSAFAGANEGEVALYAEFNGVQTLKPLMVRTADDRVLPTELHELSFAGLLEGQDGEQSTFAGVAGSKITPMFGAAFSDGTVYGPDDLKNGDGEVYPGVAKFAVGPGSAEHITVDGSTGEVTLLGNHHETVSVRAGVAGAKSSLTEQIWFAANLEPTVGDVDLGQRSGLPIPSSEVGAVVTVPLRVRLPPDVPLASLHFRVSVAPYGILDFIDAVPSAEWPGGLLQFVSGNGDDGSIDIGGFSSHANATGLVDVIELRFKALTTGVFRLSGEVVTLTGRDGGAVVESSTFVAGDVTGEIGGGRKRSRKSVGSNSAPPRPMRRGATKRDAHRADGSCTDALPGDANGDCVVDVRDAAYLFESFGDCPKERRIECDPDGNGVIDAADALYQLGYVLGRYPLVRDLQIAPASERSSCLMTLKVNVFYNDPVHGPIAAPADKVSVFFDIEFGSAAEANAVTTQLNQTRFSNMVAVEAGEKSVGYSGALWQANRSPQGPFMLRAESGLKMLGIGVSVIVATKDYRGFSSQARIAPLAAGAPDPPYTYNGALSLDLPLGNGVVGSLNRPLGYNPRSTFDHPITTTECQSGATVYATTSTVVTTVTATTLTTTVTVPTTTTSTTTPTVTTTTMADVFEEDDSTAEAVEDGGNQAISTTSTEPVVVGATVIKTASNDGFAVGDKIMIGRGTANSEVNSIVGFGSILLATPLTNNHPMGTTIEAITAEEAAAATVAAAAAAADAAAAAKTVATTESPVVGAATGVDNESGAPTAIIGAVVAVVLLILIGLWVKGRMNDTGPKSLVTDATAHVAAAEMMRRSSFVENTAASIPEAHIAPYVDGDPVVAEIVQETAFAGGYLNIGDEEEEEAAVTSDEEEEEADQVEMQTLGFFFGATTANPHSVVRDVLSETAAKKQATGCTMGPKCPCPDCKTSRADARQTDQVHHARRRKSAEMAEMVSELTGVSSPDPGFAKQQSELVQGMSIAPVKVHHAVGGKMRSDATDIFAGLEASLMSIHGVTSGSSLFSTDSRRASVLSGGSMIDDGGEGLWGDIQMELGGGSQKSVRLGNAPVETIFYEPEVQQCTYLGTCTCPDCQPSL
jgi:hypothetical protein